MNALLVYPDSPNVFFNLQHTLEVLGKKAMLPPLGLLTVGALLPETWSKRFVDLRVRGLTADDLHWADYAFMSLTAVHAQEESALYAVAVCKAAGIKVVIGGVGFWPDDETLDRHFDRYAAVDHFILNEAEVTLPRFLEDLERGQPERVYRSDELSAIRLDNDLKIVEMEDSMDIAALFVAISEMKKDGHKVSLVPPPDVLLPGYASKLINALGTVVRAFRR
jgi:radical SAM superfamily enzyme YgiQ (UPF0313 family)